MVLYCMWSTYRSVTLINWGLRDKLTTASHVINIEPSPTPTGLPLHPHPHPPHTISSSFIACSKLTAWLLLSFPLSILLCFFYTDRMFRTNWTFFPHWVSFTPSNQFPGVFPQWVNWYGGKWDQWKISFADVISTAILNILTLKQKVKWISAGGAPAYVSSSLAY